MGLDSIGLIPVAGGAGTLARRFGNMKGFRGIVADQFGSRAIRTSQDMSGGFSIADGLNSEDGIGIGLTLVGFIPGAGQISAGASISFDIYKTYKAIEQCQ